MLLEFYGAYGCILTSKQTVIPQSIAPTQLG